MVHLYSAFIQDALHRVCITFTHSHTHSYTDGRGNHARHQPAHREQLALGEKRDYLTYTGRVYDSLFTDILGINRHYLVYTIWGVFWHIPLYSLIRCDILPPARQRQTKAHQGVWFIPLTYKLTICLKKGEEGKQPPPKKTHFRLPCISQV